MQLLDEYLADLKAIFPGQIALDLAQFAKVTGMSENSIRTMLSRGQLSLRTIKPGKRRLVPLTEVAELLAEKTSQRRRADRQGGRP
jgi:hypothetical protein